MKLLTASLLVLARLSFATAPRDAVPLDAAERFSSAAGG